jgi:hypothetical protein
MKISEFVNALINCSRFFMAVCTHSVFGSAFGDGVGGGW